MIQYMEVNHATLAYEVSGSGRPLLLIHGNGEDHTIFEEAVQVLKKHFTCYAIDSRGHGNSSPASELHYEDMAKDILDFMDCLNLQDVIFYGFSDGGIIGLLAAMQSVRIRDLIISGANIHPLGVKPSVLMDIRKEYRKTRNSKLALMIREPHIKRSQLGKITANTLVLAGQRDVIIYPHTRKIARSIPKSHVKILKGEDHGSYIIHSTGIAKIIIGWIKRQS